MQCLQGIDCGDAGTWAAAIATLLAVLVALRNAGASTRTALELQRRGHDREDAKERALRHQLAVAFDGDIYLLMGQYDLFLSHLDGALERGSAAEVLHTVEQLSPSGGLAMVDRFAERADVFPDIVAGQLVSLVGRWNMMRNGPRLPTYSDAVVLEGAKALQNASAAFRRDMAFTRDQLAQFMLPGTKMTPQ